MNLKTRLLFGPLAAGRLAIGVAGLALLIPDYRHVRAYVLLVLYQQYHSVGDIISTLLVLAGPVCALAYASQAAADNSSGPKPLRGSDQLLR